jgi:hypothetical protein
MLPSQYARTRKISPRALRHQINRGVVAIDDRGRVDPGQADDAYGRVRRARFTAQDSESGRQSARAKILAAMAALRLAQDRLAGLRDRYVDRIEAVNITGADVETFLAALAAIPERNGAALAQTLGIGRRDARRMLDRFVALAVAELGDLRAEALRTVEQT